MLTWQQDLEKLTPQQKEDVEGWVGTNLFIADELGLSEEEWWAIVEWAFQNPDDWSFLEKIEAFSNKDKLDEAGPDQRAIASKLGGAVKDIASIPKVGEEKPEGSLSLSALNFPRRG